MLIIKIGVFSQLGVTKQRKAQIKSGRTWFICNGFFFFNEEHLITHLRMQIVPSGRSAHSKHNWMDFCFQTNRQLRFHQHVHHVLPHVLTSCAPQFQMWNENKTNQHQTWKFFDIRYWASFFVFHFSLNKETACITVNRHFFLTSILYYFIWIRDAVGMWWTW